VRWLRVAFDDVVSAITSVVRPWIDLRAVKTIQVDIVKAVASQKDDIANVIASVNKLGDELNRMKARESEYETRILEIRAAIDFMKRDAGN
jgi:seryl-tRNA synthetase